MECIDTDPKLMQICLVICGVPLVFQTQFDYIKLQSTQQKCVFGEILNKLSKQYRVPSIEELRYSEIYEFTFARRNAQYDSGFSKHLAQHEKFS